MNRLVRCNPMSVLNDINRLFEQSFCPLSDNSDTSRVESGQWAPAVDIKEEEVQFDLRIDLPGVDKKDVKITMENNVLTVQGERCLESKTEEDSYYRVERISGRFCRRFTLPETADEQNVKAKMAKGVLYLTIPKKEATQPKAIEIHAED